MNKPTPLHPFSMSLPGEPEGWKDLRPRPVAVTPENPAAPTEDGFGHPSAALDAEIAPDEPLGAPESVETASEAPQEPETPQEDVEAIQAIQAESLAAQFDPTADAEELSELL